MLKSHESVSLDVLSMAGKCNIDNPQFPSRIELRVSFVKLIMFHDNLDTKIVHDHN